MNTVKPYKILVIAPSWVGDMVMSQTLLKILKQQRGDACQIDILVNDWAKDVAKRMPEINQVFINPFKHGEFGLAKRFRLGRQLAKERYDQCFVLPNSLKSALIPFFAGIKRRTGFIGEMRYGLLNDSYRLDKQALPLMIERFCALVNDGNKPVNIPYPKFAIDKSNQNKILQNLGLSLDKPVICLAPAAEYGPAKRWPTAHFAKLSSQLQQQGYQIWLMGSAKDAELAEEIITQAVIKRDIHNLCGKTNLVEVIDLLACAEVVVSNDSGLMHVACAVNVPVIAIYGSSSPGFTPPLSDKAVIQKIEIECAPCFARTCKFEHYNCLQQVLPETILNCIEQIKASYTGTDLKY
ncbi:MAG TPA: lipopolysaccharide heptosyltransferase II [Burkholderiales bacterium]|nr:lipopolysaccharide heptosyltransferase II [Burkholderiales bacterium]